MKRFVFVLALLLLVSGSSEAWAQRGQGRGMGRRPGGNPFGLLSQKSVQDELKLSDDQIKKVEAQQEKQREAFASLRDLDPAERQTAMANQAKASQAALADILKEDQLTRFKQISLQQRGGQALEDPEVATALNLTSEQNDRVKAIQEGVQGEMRELFQAGAAGGDRAELQKKAEALRTSTSEKLLGVLTEGQQAKWKAMQGPPFKGEIRQGRGRGRGA
jgi:hypothetical protein